jgi:hypothetical protein
VRTVRATGGRIDKGELVVERVREGDDRLLLHRRLLLLLLLLLLLRRHSLHAVRIPQRS